LRGQQLKIEPSHITVHNPHSTVFLLGIQTLKEEDQTGKFTCCVLGQDTQ